MNRWSEGERQRICSFPFALVTMQDGTDCRSSWKGSTQSSSDDALKWAPGSPGWSRGGGRRAVRPLASVLMFCHVHDLCCVVFCLVSFFSLFTAHNPWDIHSLAQSNKCHKHFAIRRMRTTKSNKEKSKLPRKRPQFIECARKCTFIR